MVTLAHRLTHQPAPGPKDMLRSIRADQRIIFLSS